MQFALVCVLLVPPPLCVCRVFPLSSSVHIPTAHASADTGFAVRAAPQHRHLQPHTGCLEQRFSPVMGVSVAHDGRYVAGVRAGCFGEVLGGH